MHFNSVGLIFLTKLLLTTCFSFFPQSQRIKRSSNTAFFTSTVETLETTQQDVLKTNIPSWEDLSNDLDSITSDQELEIKDNRTPLLTLYRDTNGWCPFCERVWVYLEAKNIPYNERLINLQNKPEWYKDLVPTTLVPAIVIHDDIISNQTSASTDNEVIQPERRVIWESSKIIEVLDELFDDKNNLVLDTEEYKKAEEMNSEIGTAGFQYIYSSRNTSLTTDDILQRKMNFEAKLDELDTELLAHGGPFRLGKEFTVLDALMIPTLERWRYQLPITTNINILSERKGLQNWFHAMESYEPYINRVAGDEYSWTAVASYFLKIFNSNGTNVSDDTKDAMLRADNAAIALENSFVDNCNKIDDQLSEKNGKAKLLAADKIITNYEAIIQDCTRTDPKTQVHVPRAINEQSVDLLLRYVVHALLQSTTINQTLDKVISESCTPMLTNIIEDKDDASVAARTIARRLCVPRDMGALSGTFLRGALSMVATSLEK